LTPEFGKVYPLVPTRGETAETAAAYPSEEMKLLEPIA
jgi:hypothetical protein